ncbi:MAG: PAS domain-containing protein [Bacteroidota bacterium]
MMVLLISDDNDEVIVLKKQLLALGYDENNIICTSSLSKATSLITDTIEIAIVEISLLQTSSEVQKSFLQTVKHIPFIVVSITDDLEQLTHGIDEGAQDYLLKEDILSGSLDKAIQKAILRKRYVLSNTVSKNKHKKDSIANATEVTTILESITDAFFTVDAEWNFIYVNKEAEKLYKRKREELLHKPMWEYFTEGNQSKFFTEFHRAVRDHVSVHFEEYSSSTEMWIATNAYPTGNGLTVYFSDITEQKKLQDKIAKDEQNLRAIINNTRDIIWSIDREYNIISANQAFYKRMTNSRAENFYYIRLATQDFDNEAFGKWIIYYNRAFSGETFKVVEKTVLDYNVIYEDISFNPIYDNEDNIIGVSCFSRDITERRSHVLRIESQNEKLKEIAWIQSHKVRGPVASILGLVELFSHNIPAEDNNKEMLEGLKTVTKDLDDTIKSIVEKANTIEL